MPSTPASRQSECYGCLLVGSADSIHDVNAVVGMLQSELGGQTQLDIRHLQLGSNVSIREQAQMFDHMAVAIQVSCVALLLEWYWLQHATSAELGMLSSDH